MQPASLITTLRRIARVAEPKRTLVLGVFVFISLSSLFQMVGLSLVIPVLNGLAESKKFAGLERTPVLGEIIKFLPFTQTDGGVFLFLMGLIFLAVLFENITLYLGQRLYARISTDTVYNIRRNTFGRYLSFSKSFFDQQQIGELSSFLTHVSTHIGNLVEQLSRLLILVAFSFAFFALMLVISWELTLLAGVLLPITHFLSRSIAKRIQVSARGEVDASVKFSGRVVDLLSNMSLVHLSGAERIEQNRVSSLADEVRRHGFNVRSKRFAAPRVVDVVDSLGILLVVCLGVYLYFATGSESPGRFFVYFLSLRRFTNHLEQVTGVVASVFETAASAERLLWVFDDVDKDFTVSGQRSFPGLKGELRYVDVSFAYRQNQPVLDGVSFAAKRGEIVALVGASGAGKTTLLNLIPRFYEPTSGRIEIDGVDLREFDIEGLRGRISVVSQDALLLSESLRENLVYGLSPAPTIEQINAVLKASALEVFVASLPEGLETKIGTKGVMLSGGEKQRLSLARAILREPEILILDEATSALDSETELRIQQALERLFVDRTVFIIAHRLSTVSKASQVLVLDQGRIVERGSPQELIRSGGKFSKYWELQNATSRSESTAEGLGCE